ncbi:hypothetical protein LCGC14_2607700 [marine sediment metagenome]|uniref:Uncharacterized protein n=1 Tax=marine sediment metagenome TaxID=412755 RepID=A0A0F9A735_9ZZZZ
MADKISSWVAPGIQLDKLDALETLDEKLQLIYEWVKAGHINLAQFKRLTCDTVVNNFMEQNSLPWTD